MKSSRRHRSTLGVSVSFYPVFQTRDSPMRWQKYFVRRCSDEARFPFGLTVFSHVMSLYPIPSTQSTPYGTPLSSCFV